MAPPADCVANAAPMPNTSAGAITALRPPQPSSWERSACMR